MNQRTRKAHVMDLLHDEIAFEGLEPAAVRVELRLPAGSETERRLRVLGDLPGGVRIVRAEG